MAAMAAEGLINEEFISSQELDRVYGPLRQQVVDSCQRQDMLMARIQVSLGQDVFVYESQSFFKSHAEH